ncbi:SH3 domain-binding protein 2 [Biomphalaria pfeifferi]|uniref:SH3 domain-binding protein 2 n=1 Tax=Biomphalaria pfeifferi TaxID=112525 RepID=A0AAD8FB63_BIOPF|nr:SH3 domain-binding protein 2 [Biomphalaria pfeifferi]
MASAVYDPGVLGVRKPENCGCQELLAKQNLVHYGWLRKRCLRNKLQINFFNWPQLYVVLVECCLYYFKNELSKKPAGSISLYGYNRIIRASEIKIKEVPWAFKIEHIQPDVRSLYFAASSEAEMVSWMKMIKSEMLKANNISSGMSNFNMQQVSKSLSDTVSMASDFSWSSSDYNDLEEGIYKDTAGCQNRQSFYSDAVPIHQFEDEYIDDGEQSPSSQRDKDVAPALPKRPAFSKASAPVYSLQKTPIVSTKQKTDSYWPNVYFQGDKIKAAQIINSIGENGVYLVRKSEDDSNVLVFYSKTAPRKFKIIEKDNGQLTLSSSSGPSFQNVEDLLYHYYYNKLPGLEETLTTPYKLHPLYKEK